jgi:hypothetical protein
VSVIVNKNMYMYRCLILNSFRDRAISLYSSKIVYKQAILRTVLIAVFIVHVKELVQFT